MASADAPQRRPRVCALVVNSVSHDARVLKEADSLAAAGFDMTIIGIRDARNGTPEERRESGVRILRVAWRAAAYRRLALIVAVAGAGLMAALVGISLTVPYHLTEEVVPLRTERFWLSLVTVLLTVAVGYKTLRRVRALLKVSRRYQAIEAHEAEGLQRSRFRIRLRSAVARVGRVWDGLRPIGSPLLGLRSRVRSAVASRYRSFSWYRPIAYETRKLRPDIVHCHDVYTLPIGSRVKRELQCALVYDAHEIYEAVAQNRAEVGALHRRTQRRHARGVDRFITINDSIARFYAERYQIPDPVIIKNATVPAGPIAYDGRLHEAAGLPRSQRIVLYQGGFAPKRGLEVLVASAADLPAEWTLVMMGWGHLEAALRADSAALGSTMQRVVPPVVFVPAAPQQELALWSAGASIGVIPYENVGLNHWFATPNKLWEYPNAGVPMLVSPFPEMSRVIDRYGVGWKLPDPMAPADLAVLLAQITDEDLREARAACAAFIAEDNWSRYAERLVDLYTGLAGGPAHPARRPSPDVRYC